MKMRAIKNLLGRERTLRKEEVNLQYPTKRGSAEGRATRSKGVAILLKVLPPPNIAQSTRGRVTLRRGVTRAAGQIQTGKVMISGLLLGIAGITRRIVTITIIGEGEKLTNTMKMTVTMIASVTLTGC